MANANENIGSEKQTPGDELRALDPDLPMLAARAAMQLDLAIGAARRGESTKLIRTDALDKLAELVTSVSTSILGNAETRALMDPLTVSIVSRAYSDASDAPLKSWKDLDEAAKKLTELFSGLSNEKRNSTDPIKGLQLLRDFCVKLSEYAASKRQLAYGERPVPVHWRLH